MAKSAIGRERGVTKIETYVFRSIYSLWSVVENGDSIRIL